MKHYVLGFVFNQTENRVLLVKKKRPEWQKGHWNGIGGKIESVDRHPLDAMLRESVEETGHNYPFKHKITFDCPGGTVYVFAATVAVYGTSKGKELIPFQQLENELLQVWELINLPATTMSNLKWIIPLCLADLQFPIMIHQNTLGV